MDPISLTLIGLSLVAGAVGALFMRKRTAQQLSEQPEPIPQPPPASHPHEWVTREEKPERDRGRTAEHIIAAIVSRVSFCAKRVLAGYDTVQRSLGRQEQEVSYPGDGVRVRPMRDLGELGVLLPYEQLADEDTFLARVATQEALVVAQTAEVEIFEDVDEPRWEERKRILYVLLDVSWSMFPRSGGEARWRPQIWRPLVIALLNHAMKHEAIFLTREFGGSVRELRRAAVPEEAGVLRRHFEQVDGDDRTDIPQAISTAIRDFKDEEYDEGEIVIVTDGEDNRGINIDQLCAQLEEAKLKLHAVLLGANNEALRACADRYQVVEQIEEGKFRLHEMVSR